MLVEHRLCLLDQPVTPQVLPLHNLVLASAATSLGEEEVGEDLARRNSETFSFKDVANECNYMLHFHTAVLLDRMSNLDVGLLQLIIFLLALFHRCHCAFPDIDLLFIILFAPLRHWF